MNPTSKIKLPDNSVLDIKDANAGYSLSVDGQDLNLLNAAGNIISTIQMATGDSNIKLFYYNASQMCLLEAQGSAGLEGAMGYVQKNSYKWPLNTKLIRPDILYILNGSNKILGRIVILNPELNFNRDTFYKEIAYNSVTSGLNMYKLSTSQSQNISPDSPYAYLIKDFDSLAPVSYSLNLYDYKVDSAFIADKYEGFFRDSLDIMYNNGLFIANASSAWSSDCYLDVIYENNYNINNFGLLQNYHNYNQNQPIIFDWDDHITNPTGLPAGVYHIIRGLNVSSINKIELYDLINHTWNEVTPITVSIDTENYKGITADRVAFKITSQSTSQAYMYRITYKHNSGVTFTDIIMTTWPFHNV